MTTPKTPAPTPRKKTVDVKKTTAKPKTTTPAAKKTAEKKKETKPSTTRKASPAAKTPAKKSVAKTDEKKATVAAKPAASAAKPSAAKVWRIKVLCVAGPYWDADGPDVCLRTIDVLDNCSLYDLHAAILESVHFEEHDESVFTYFTAANYRAKRTYLGDGAPLSAGTEIERFEDIPLSDALPSEPRRFLFYAFDADDPWVFLVVREPSERDPSPHEFYPFVRDELNDGPDPVQNGDGLDDFADADEGAEFNELRRDFRRQRREREESGLGDYDDDDDGEGFDLSEVFPDDDRGFFSGDGGDPYGDGDGDDGDDW